MKRFWLLTFAFHLSLSLAHADERLLPAKTSVEVAFDHYIRVGLNDAKIRPNPLLDDAGYLRRVTLDLNGRIPTAGELHDYLTDTTPDKKTRLVDRLLAAPNFAKHQAQEFATLLAAEEPGRRAKSAQLLAYLRKGFQENRSWDRMFREMMIANDADKTTEGASDFLKSRIKDLNKVAIDVSTLFFGVNVSCAQCHDHPHVEAWTQDHFYGMKAFFARTVENGGFLAEKEFATVKYIPVKGATKGKEREAPVMFLTGKILQVPGQKEPSAEEKKKDQQRLDKAKKDKKIADPPSISMRQKLVETALDKDQREVFARSIVNRLVHRFFGQGLVMPLDQMHSENPPSHPELLDWLSRDLIEHNYDLRRLARGFALTETYARQSHWEGKEVPLPKLFARGLVRPLTPHQMALSLKMATLDPETIPSEKSELDRKLGSLEQSSERWTNYFPVVTEFFQVGVTEAMLFANNDAFARELLEGEGMLAKRLLQEPDLAKRSELAIRVVLGRDGRPDEIQKLVDFQRERLDRPREACQHIVWALLTTAEFRFNH